MPFDQLCWLQVCLSNSWSWSCSCLEAGGTLCSGGASLAPPRSSVYSSCTCRQVHGNQQGSAQICLFLDNKSCRIRAIVRSFEVVLSHCNFPDFCKNPKQWGWVNSAKGQTPTQLLSPPPQQDGEKTNRMRNLIDWVKDRETNQQLLLQAKQTQLEEG